MRNLVITLIIVLVFTNSCKSQTVSLKQTAASMKSTGVIPKNSNYLKDTDNSLNKFVGTWMGEYNGFRYEFNFIKRIKYGENPMKDILIGRFSVKDSNGNLVYNTLSESDEKTGLKGDNFQSDMKFYKLNYLEIGRKCGKSGIVYIGSKEIEKKNKLNLTLVSHGDIRVQGECDNYLPLIPFGKMINLSKL